MELPSGRLMYRLLSPAPERKLSSLDDGVSPFRAILIRSESHTPKLMAPVLAAPPYMERRLSGDDVAIPTRPLLRNVKAGTVVVANVLGDAVAKYKLPLMLRCVQ